MFGCIYYGHILVSEWVPLDYILKVELNMAFKHTWEGVVKKAWAKYSFGWPIYENIIMLV